MLKDQYFFKCECTACKSNEENKQRGYLCSQCNGCVILNKDNTNFCLNCKLKNQAVNKKLVDESLMLIRIAKKKFTLKKFEDTLDDANEAYTKLVDCVHRHNKQLRVCLDLLADCYYELGHYSIASQYLKINFKLIKEIYSLKSVECLVAFTKICNLDSICVDKDAKIRLSQFVDEYLKEFEDLEQQIANKIDNFKGLDELKIVKEIRSKIVNC